MSDKIEVSRELLERASRNLCSGEEAWKIQDELLELLGPVRYQVLFPARGGVPAGYRICTKDVAGQWFREGLPMLTPDPSRVKELDYPTTLNRMGKVKL
jgi:hypothetical protein